VRGHRAVVLRTSADGAGYAEEYRALSFGGLLIKRVEDSGRGRDVWKPTNIEMGEPDDGLFADLFRYPADYAHYEQTIQWTERDRQQCGVARITHQPEVPAERPRGTLFFIRARPNSRTISLHKFWDDFIIGSGRFSRVSNRATELRQRQEFRREALTELSENRFLRWANTESFTLAKRDAYRNGSLQGSTSEDNGALLPQNYANAVRPIAERRAVLAGYRIAELLSRTF